MSILKRWKEKQNEEWKNSYPPERTLLHFGFDQQKNPCYLIFYGTQHIAKKFKNQLENRVTYHSYAIFRGTKGHFPCFPKVKIIEGDWNWKTSRYETKKMYYKYQGFSYYQNREKFEVKEFVALKKEQHFDFPYYSMESFEFQMENFLHLLSKKNIIISDFIFVKDKKEFIPLASEENSIFVPLLFDLITSDSLYKRKKKLVEFLSKKPSQKTLALLLSIGSSETIAGLFLEMAKSQNDCLLEEAKILLSETCDFAKGYATGVKRCITIYLNSFHPEKREQRINWIKNHYTEMDLKIIRVKGKLVPKELTGKDYFNYKQRGYFWDSDYEEDSFYKRYEEGTYTDGYEIKITSVKNTIQEAELYKMAEIIGKIAYYFDSPRLYCYFYGKGFNKSFQYFRRYLRRIMDQYRREDPDKFMEAMVSLLTSYSEDDILRNYGVTDNIFIHYYLNFRTIFQEHMEAVIEILKNAKCDDVLKPCFAILLESDQKDTLFSKFTYETFISLATSNSDYIREYFLTLLQDKVNHLTGFDSDLFFLLIQSSNAELVSLAKEYKKKVKGRLTKDQFLSVLEKDVCVEWIDLLQEDLLSYSQEEYCSFIKELLPYFIEKLQVSKEFPAILLELMENLLFSLSIEELKRLLLDITIEPKIRIAQQNKKIVSFLKAIQSDSFPSDAQILNILDTSTSKMIKILIDFVLSKEDELKEKLSTLFLMLESNVTVWNQKAEEIFDQLPSAIQKKFHSQILDSPVPKVYQFGIQKLTAFYGSYLPKEFIISLFEHPAFEVKAFLSNKIDMLCKNLECCDQELFLYYIRNLLLIPNKLCKEKNNICKVVPKFITFYPERYEQIEALLLEIGHSNCIKDTERALTTLVQIRKVVAVN